jgi:thiol-disulfide isomerase/thioredoxin
MSYHVIDSLEDYYLLHTTSPKNIVLYTASWCRPCKELKEFLHENYPDLSVPLLIVDVEHPDLTDLIGEVQAMPTLEFYESGQIVNRMEGFRRAEITRLLKEWLP